MVVFLYRDIVFFENEVVYIFLDMFFFYWGFVLMNFWEDVGDGFYDFCYGIWIWCMLFIWLGSDLKVEKLFGGLCNGVLLSCRNIGF